MLDQTSNNRTRRGFTLVEVLVVIGLISFLMVISIAVVANFISRAREEATAATILKIQKLYLERLEAFQRSLKGPQFEAQVNAKLAQFQSAGVASGQNLFGIQRRVAETLVKKDLYKAAFRQSVNEPNLPQLLTTNTVTAADSSEAMFYTLTRQDVFGIPPVGTDAFSTAEYGDTDDDGNLEFLDAWGRPLRFYRWPTRLIKPSVSGVPVATGTPIRSTADLLIKGLPKRPVSTGRDPLNQDPDDALGYLSREVKSRFPALATLAAPLGVNETNYHTLDTWHAFLIVSAGADGKLGLFEPDDFANFGHLAMPTGPAVASYYTDDLTDNITNRNRRAGGN
jgi:prepilin-type N-terminal cleavage/methylation domain-containing protein